MTEMKIIARIRTELPEKFGVPRQSGLVPQLRGRVVFEPGYRNPDAVRGLEDFSHIWLIWQLSQAVREDWSPTVRPPRLGGNRRMGVIATHDGQAVCFDETDVRAMGRTAVGVRGIRLREGDYVVGAAKAVPGKTVLSITERGYGKRTAVEEYRITARGGLGIRNYMVTEKTGPIVGIKVVDGTEDLLLVTEAGILIRTAVENIRIAGRATQGVIVMRFKEEGDRVISMALTDREQETEKE